MYHGLPKSCDNEAEYFDSIDSVDVALETSVNATFIAACERAGDIKLNTLSIPLIQINKEIDDKVKINDNFIDKCVVPLIQNEVLSDDDIKHTEIVTRGQSENKLWQQLHQFKATTSNFFSK